MPGRQILKDEDGIIQTYVYIQVKYQLTVG